MTTREIKGGKEILSGVETVAPDEGCGTELRKLLALGRIHAESGCACKSMERKMNCNGPQWCRENLAEIVNVMAKEAKRRKMPFLRFVAKRLVLSAIRRYEVSSSKHARKESPEKVLSYNK